MSLRAKALAVFLSAASTVTLASTPAEPEGRVPHGLGLGCKKGPRLEGDELPPMFATLEQVHTGEHLVLDAFSPTQDRFDALLADRATGAEHALDPHLLLLLRALAAEHPGGRIELVSGYRSPKLNEMLRKKGHHVSSHSQHSLGHACDFRLYPAGAERALDPRDVEVEIRKLGWQGGIGVYPAPGDWFVHADVGPLRRWEN
jgi:uncharacterized protein YcbK (DUF882 family)